jgi:hypothetical protein
MSGIEVVGVVLGLYPVVLTALSAYRDSRSDSSQLAKKLTRNLRIERMIYESIVFRLLSQGVSESQARELLAQPNPDISGTLWHETDLRDAINDRLEKTSSTDVALSVVRDIEELLRSVDIGLSELSAQTVRNEVCDVRSLASPG